MAVAMETIVTIYAKAPTPINLLVINQNVRQQIATIYLQYVIMII